MPQKILTTTKIRCGGKIHKISLAGNGKLVFHDHPRSMELERVCVALGAEPCRCLEVLEIWREKIKDSPNLTRKQSRKMPRELVPFTETMRSTFYRRRFNSTFRMDVQPIFYHTAVKTTDRSSARLYSMPKHFLRAVQSSIAKILMGHYVCAGNVRRTYAADANGVLVIGSIHADINIEHRKGRSQEMFILRLLPSWYKSVYQRGLAVVDGAFVVKIASETADRIHVYAVCQKPKKGGYLIVPNKAHINLSPDGKPIGLQWAD